MKNKLLLILAQIIILLFYCPYFIEGENCLIRVGDNFDHLIPINYVLSQSGKIFSDNNSLIPNYMGGLPRSVFPCEFNLVFILIHFFGTLYGYIFNMLLVSIIAFWSMYYLLKSVFNINYDFKTIHLVGTSLAWSLLPYWPPGGAFIAAIPFIFAAFYKANNKESNNIILSGVFLYPAYSSFIMVSFFLCLILVSYYLYIFYKKKFIEWYVVKTFLFFIGGILFFEYRLFIKFFDNQSFISHRIEFLHAFSGWKSYANEILSWLLNGHWHAPGLQKYFIIPTIIFTIFLLYVTKHGESRFEKEFKNIIFIFLLLIMVTCVSYMPMIKRFLMDLIPIHLERFYILFPFFYFILFAYSLYLILEKISFGKYIFLIIILLQLTDTLRRNMYYYKNIWPTYKEYVEADIYNQIKKYINKPITSYRVGTLYPRNSLIRIDPAIALLNGFYTVDGYIYDYPLEYKHRFRKIISKQISIDKYLINYFDNWGNQAYLFCLLNQDGKINTSGFNWPKFKELGGQYVLSPNEIEMEYELNLQFLKEFTSEVSKKKIFLYRVL